MKGRFGHPLFIFSVFFLCSQVVLTICASYDGPYFVMDFAEQTTPQRRRDNNAIYEFGNGNICLELNSYQSRFSGSHASRHIGHKTIEKCSSSDWSNYWTNRTKEKIHPKNWSEQARKQLLFCNFALYEHAGYRAFLQTLPEYNLFIVDTNNLQEWNEPLKEELSYILTDCSCKNLSEHIERETSGIRAKWAAQEAKQAEKNRQFEQEKLAKIKAERNAVQKKSVQEIKQLIQINPSFSLKSDQLVADDQTNVRDNYSWSGRLARRREATIHVTKNQTAYEHKTFSISTEFKEFVVAHGGNAQHYTECIGNQLQQVLHEELIEVVHEASDLYECDVEKKLEVVQGMLVGFAGSGCQHNKAGQMIKALQLTDLCWSLLEYGDVVIKVSVDSVDGQDCRIALKIVHEQVVMHLGCLLKNEITIRNYKDFKRITRIHGNKYIRDGFRRVQDNIALVSDHLLSGRSSGHTKILHSFFGAATRDLQTCPQTKDEFEAFYECCDGISIKLANDSAWKFRKFVEKRQSDTQKILNDACFKRLEFETHKQQELQDYIDDQMIELAMQHVDSDEPFDAGEITDVQELSEENLKSMLTCPSEYEAMWRHRIARRQALAQEALEDKQGYKSEFFEISPASAEFLELHDCDPTVFEQCTGNEFQQALHKDFVDVVTDAASWPAAQSEQQQELVNATQALLTSLAQQGCKENKAGNIVESTLLADACKCLQIYGKSVALGFWDGIVDTAEIVMRPDRAIMGILSFGWAAISNAALLSYDSIMSDIHYCLEGVLYEDKGRWKKHEQRFNDRVNRGLKLVKKAYKAFQETSGPDRVRLATRIATNFALHGKVIQLRGAAISAVKPYVGAFTKPIFNKVKNWGARLFARRRPSPKLVTTHGVVPSKAVQKFKNVAKQDGQLIKKVGPQARKVKKTTKKIVLTEDKAKHIFRKKEGHLPIDTPANRKLFFDLISNKKYFLGKCRRHGKLWYGKSVSGGKQLWAEVINGRINDAGLNDIPRKFNPETGFSRQFPPRLKSCKK